MNVGEAVGLLSRQGEDETGRMSEIPVVCCAGTNIGVWALRMGTLLGESSSNEGCNRVDVRGVPCVPFPSALCTVPSCLSFFLAVLFASSSRDVACCAQNSGLSTKKKLARLVQCKQCSQGSPWTHCSHPLHGCRASEHVLSTPFMLAGEWSSLGGVPVGESRYMSSMLFLKSKYNGGVLYMVSETVWRDGMLSCERGDPWLVDAALLLSLGGGCRQCGCWHGR